MKEKTFTMHFFAVLCSRRFVAAAGWGNRI